MEQPLDPDTGKEGSSETKTDSRRAKDSRPGLNNDLALFNSFSKDTKQAAMGLHDSTRQWTRTHVEHLVKSS